MIVHFTDGSTAEYLQPNEQITVRDTRVGHTEQYVSAFDSMLDVINYYAGSSTVEMITELGITKKEKHESIA